MTAPSGRPGRAPLTVRDLGLLVPFALAALFAVRGRTVAAAVVAVVGVAVLLARLLLGDAVPRATARIARAAERVLTSIVVALAWCVIVLPAWLFRRLRRADRPSKTDPGSRWVASPPSASDTRTFGTPPSPGPRRSLLLRSIGVVVVLLVVDSMIGIAWQWFTRSDVTAPVTEALGVARDGTNDDPRAQTPALADYPWAGEQLRELQNMPGAYWPFTVTRPLPHEGETVTILGWDRLSYEPRDADDDIPVVAFFGGSTTFGEGQRDDHTIPSEIARLAEEAGTPIRVVNYGQRAWTTWQEAMLFEQLSADPDDPDHPDLVVFYDGANEVAQQQQDSTAGWPTHFNVDGVARTLTGHDAGAGAGEGGAPSTFESVVDWYSSRSMAVRVLRSVGLVGADEGPPAAEVSKDPPEEVGARAASVYTRARDFIASTAERRGIDVVFFWQPVRDRDRDLAYRAATAGVDDDTIDISDVLDDHQGVYFDSVHTNEVGALIVAERMWETALEQQVRDAS